MTFAYGRTRGVNAGVIRIFNTYGPRMSGHDGRVVTNFITQALNGDPITIYGNGKQTRSFCYVDDLVRGIVAMIDSAERGPINLGNPDEFTIADFAALVLRITGSSAPVEHRPLPVDDPLRRRPDISRAQNTLGWRPEVPPAEGVRRTAEWLLSGPLLGPDVRMLEGLRLPSEIGRSRVHAEAGQIQPGAEKGGTQAEDESIPG
jgi:dTDP-glucose 4,6-dehydratase